MRESKSTGKALTARKRAADDRAAISLQLQDHTGLWKPLFNANGSDGDYLHDDDEGEQDAQMKRMKRREI
jgi:hypothetical protein